MSLAHYRKLAILILTIAKKYFVFTSLEIIRGDFIFLLWMDLLEGMVQSCALISREFGTVWPLVSYLKLSLRTSEWGLSAQCSDSTVWWRVKSRASESAWTRLASCPFHFNGVDLDGKLSSRISDFHAWLEIKLNFF